MSRSVLSLVLALLLAFSGLILTTRPVSVRASTGTITVPDDYPTIRLAVNAASNGDTVFIRSGTYYTNQYLQDIIVVQTAISLIGENPNNTTILGGYGGTVIKIVSNGVNVTGLTIGDAGNGYDAASIHLENVTGCKISQNVLSGSRFGIWLHNSSNNEISNNNITSNTSYGVLLASSSNNSVVGNTLTNNFDGIQFDNSNYNRLRDNTVNNAVHGYIGIHGSELTDFFNDVDPSNSLSGKPICYFVNKQHEVVPENAGYVAVVNSTDILIANLSIGRNEQGILLVQVTNSTIEGNTINYNHDGILALSSNNNSILRNTFWYNHGNSIAFVSSSNNSIYLNNFIHNVVENSPDSINTWDNGTHGNYWIFSSGDILNPVDVTIGMLLNASEIDSTGIWNTSYVIDANNVDRYPLVNQVIVPEFPSATILLSFMVFACVVVALARKRRPSAL